LLIAALDGNYAPKQFGGKNRGVIVAKPVATSDQTGCVKPVAVGNHSVNEQPPILGEEHDFPTKYFAEIGPLDGNQITGK
jgi:hypothetical protein